MNVYFLSATSVVDGISFTVKPSTAKHSSAKPSSTKPSPVKHAKSYQYVYQVSVVTGESTVKGQGKKAARKDGGASARQVDSLVDNDKKPTKYVVFSNDQAYPEYLITLY